MSIEEEEYQERMGSPEMEYLQYLSEQPPEPTQLEQGINTLVRDACSVVPVPKSQYRKRLQRLVLEAQREVLADLNLNASWFPEDVGAKVTERLATIEAELKEAA